jgi:hypothetical protein
MINQRTASILVNFIKEKERGKRKRKKKEES